jgi:hypothetical protein
MMSGRGIIPVSGLIGSALLGAGAASLAQRFAPNILGGWTGPAAGFAVGGLPGAIAGYFHGATTGTNSMAGTTSQGGLYG